MNLFMLIITILLIVLLSSIMVSSKKKKRRMNNKYQDDEASSDLLNHVNKDSRIASVLDILQSPTKTELFSLKKVKLLQEKLSTNTMIENYYKFNSNNIEKQFFGETLTYVTPWNYDGYEIAYQMRYKITWLVPVWFSTKLNNNDGVVTIHGEHDIQNEWLLRIKPYAPNTTNISETCNINNSTFVEKEVKLYILPRVTIDNEQILSTEKARNQLITSLQRLQKLYNFDGYTIECPLQYWQILTLFLKQLHSTRMKIILVVPPVNFQAEQGAFHSIFINLIQYADRISLMTYDYNRSSGQVLNAPLSWVTTIITNLITVHSTFANKILMGIPLYGWRGNEAMISKTFILWLAQGDIEIQWDEIDKEHIFNDQIGRQCSFPTPLFVHERLLLANELGIAGVSLWEIGQMMPMLIDLF